MSLRVLQRNAKCNLNPEKSSQYILIYEPISTCRVLDDAPLPVRLFKLRGPLLRVAHLFPYVFANGIYSMHV